LSYKANKLLSINDLENHVPEKNYFVGIDSDGTVFNSMELKHKDCFVGCLIRAFSLASIAHEVHIVWNYVNIFSMTRGTNRFKALILTFDCLSKMESVKKSKINIPKLNSIRNWLTSNKPLTNEILKEIILNSSGNEKTYLENTFIWSENVNETVKKTVFNLPPMIGALTAMIKIKKFADVAVISNTPIMTLNREWRENNIESNVLYIGGQETGTKTEMLNAVAKDKYKSENILIIGDSFGDLKAAKNINALFFPILPLKEEESWEIFNQKGFKFFLDGNYSGEFENNHIEKFNLTLNIKPHWLH
jgi:phosphoglycolate phosphatase-like HAD superfamily hydrolase